MLELREAIPVASRAANASVVKALSWLLVRAATTELVKAPALVELKPANAAVPKVAKPCVLTRPAISSVVKAFNFALVKPATAAELKFSTPVLSKA